MVTDHSCTVYVPREEMGDIVYYRYYLPKVHFEQVYGGQIGGGGISPSTSSMVYIPLNGYIPKTEWLKLPKPWTIFGGGQQNCKVVKGKCDAIYISELKGEDVYTVQSVDVCDYGSPKLRHLEVALR